MIDYQVAVPSYKRAQRCGSATLAYLKACKIPKERITVFVADEAERDAYDDALPANSCGEIVVGVPGMGAIRNFINRHYPAGTRIVHVDDDIQTLHIVHDTTGTGEKGGMKLVPYLELEELITNAFTLCEQTKLRLWGIYPVLNAYFMKTRVTTDLRYIIGCFWGSINSHDDVLQVSLDDKEDVERTLKCYVADGGVARFEYIAPKTNYYTEPGGMQIERTEERVTASAKALVERYPQLCSLNLTKKSGHAEVRLRDKRK